MTVPLYIFNIAVVVGFVAAIGFLLWCPVQTTRLLNSPKPSRRVVVKILNIMFYTHTRLYIYTAIYGSRSVYRLIYILCNIHYRVMYYIIYDGPPMLLRWLSLERVRRKFSNFAMPFDIRCI